MLKIIDRKFLLFILVTFISCSAFCQNTVCNCSSNIDTLILKNEKNYAGFPQKVNTQTWVQYQKLKETLKKKALILNEPKSFF